MPSKVLSVGTAVLGVGLVSMTGIVALSATALAAAPPASAPAATPAPKPPADLYGDQGGEKVAPASDARKPNMVMRARGEDTFYKLSNPRVGETSGRGAKRPALLVDYEVVGQGKLDDATTLVLHADDGSRANIALRSLKGRDQGTIELVGVKWFGNIAIQKNVQFPTNVEMYITRGDDRYDPPSSVMVSNSVVMGKMKGTTHPRDWTAKEIALYTKPPPNYKVPNAHNDVGEDLPVLENVGRRYVEPEGRLLGVDFRPGEWEKEKCVGVLVPVFAADQPPTPVTTRQVAKKGYAVAGAEVHAGKHLYAIRLLFRRVKPDGTLDASDAYAGAWIGTKPASGEPRTLVNDGRRVMGIHIHSGAVVDKFALVVEK
jgi:hypothetical protein